jgi:hypothetical protein
MAAKPVLLLVPLASPSRHFPFFEPQNASFPHISHISDAMTSTHVGFEYGAAKLLRIYPTQLIA